MPNELETRLRSHQKYDTNPNIADNGFHSDYIVRELRPTASTSDPRKTRWIEVSADDHREHGDDCMTPVPNEQIQHLWCNICRKVHKNPMQCTHKEENNNDMDIDREDKTVCHIFCYNCISNWILSTGTDICPCPVCYTNIFDSNHFVSVNNETIKSAQNLIMACDYGCGLYGNHIALAKHICPLSDPKKIGHTLDANTLHTMNDTIENQMKEINALKDRNNEFELKNKQLVAKQIHIVRMNDKHAKRNIELRKTVQQLNEKINEITIKYDNALANERAHNSLQIDNQNNNRIEEFEQIGEYLAPDNVRIDEPEETTNCHVEIMDTFFPNPE